MSPYKTLCFAAGEIPAGLQRSHSLKAGVRGVLRVLSGEVDFVDEVNGGRTRVIQGGSIAIDAQTPHHLENVGSAAIEIDFFRTGG